MAQKVDYAALKKGGYMRQKQKGYGSLRLAVVGAVSYTHLFGNLIRNGYLQGKHIDGSIFDEYIHILNTMSYREIQYCCLLYTSRCV